MCLSCCMRVLRFRVCLWQGEEGRAGLRAVLDLLMLAQCDELVRVGRACRRCLGRWALWDGAHLQIKKTD